MSNDDFRLVRYSRLLNHNKRYGHFDYPPLTYGNIRSLALEYEWEQQIQSRTDGHLECDGIQHGNRFGYYALSPTILTSYTESSLASQLVYHPFDQSYRSSSTVTLNQRSGTLLAKPSLALGHKANNPRSLKRLLESHLRRAAVAAGIRLYRTKRTASWA